MAKQSCILTVLTVLVMLSNNISYSSAEKVSISNHMVGSVEYEDIDASAPLSSIFKNEEIEFFDNFEKRPVAINHLGSSGIESEIISIMTVESPASDIIEEVDEDGQESDSFVRLPTPFDHGTDEKYEPPNPSKYARFKQNIIGKGAKGKSLLSKFSRTVLTLLKSIMPYAIMSSIIAASAYCFTRFKNLYARAGFVLIGVLTSLLMVVKIFKKPTTVSAASISINHQVPVALTTVMMNGKNIEISAIVDENHVDVSQEFNVYSMKRTMDICAQSYGGAIEEDRQKIDVSPNVKVFVKSNQDY